jgi:preprotein translocase subunit SecB
MTHLPIVETLQGDVASYIPSNVISMTDGQVYMNTTLFGEGFKPAIDMGVEMNAAGRPDGLFELDLKLSVKATGDDKTPVFHVELVYGGLFALTGVAPQDIEPMLLIECPRYLFPFARQIIAQATSDGGFYPPFMVDPIDFAAIYVARQQQIASGPAETGQA